MKKALRILAATLAVVLLAPIVLPIIHALLTEPPVYALRYFVYNFSDIYDYKKFTYRDIANAPPAFHFSENLAPELFSTIGYFTGGEIRSADFEGFLEQTGSTAFIVIKDGDLRHEWYGNGFERDSWFTSFSAAKSFDSALIGIAIDEGLIGSVDDPVITYIPEISGHGLDELTIRHLLTMSSGVDYHESEDYFPTLGYLSDDARTYYYPDLRAAALTVEPGDEALGMYFHYNNYYPLLEGMILERVTGMPVAIYLQEKIWKPMGMEYPASWSLDSETSGFEKMESGINARAIDYAKFGQLFLQNGNWNGVQIISEKWVHESTTPDPDDNRPWAIFDEIRQQDGYYKYHWWGFKRENGLYDFIAEGHLGQMIYVRPDANLVMVRTGWEEGPDVSWPHVLKGLADRFGE